MTRENGGTWGTEYHNTRSSGRKQNRLFNGIKIVGLSTKYSHTSESVNFTKKSSLFRVGLLEGV